jgi:hypothetical protein
MRKVLVVVMTMYVIVHDGVKTATVFLARRRHKLRPSALNRGSIAPVSSAGKLNESKYSLQRSTLKEPLVLTCHSAARQSYWGLGGVRWNMRVLVRLGGAQPRFTMFSSFSSGTPGMAIMKNVSWVD